MRGAKMKIATALAISIAFHGAIFAVSWMLPSDFGPRIARDRRAVEMEIRPPRRLLPETTNAAATAKALVPAESEPPKPAIPVGTETARDPYYGFSQLSTPVRLLGDPQLPLPPEAVIEGKVAITVLINEQGIPDTFVIGESSLPLEYAQELGEVFSKLRFQPGEIDNKPVKSQFVVEINISPTMETIDPSKLIEKPDS